MAVDIAPELYGQIQRRFQDKYNKALASNNSIGDLRKKLDAGTATFRDADQYAVEVGSLLSESMMEVLKLDEMPNGQFYYNIAKRTLGTSLQDAYGLVSSVAAEVQEELNAANGIGLNAITPEANKERINGLVDKAVEASDQKALDKILKSPVENLVMSAVDDTVKANAEYQSKAGLQPIIKRTVLSKCCEWCSALAGTYRYPNDVPKDVYRRHQNCRCTVEYMGAGKRQDVWSKKEDVRTKAEAKEVEKSVIESKIQSPIEGRNNANGKPRAIQHYNAELNNNQRLILDNLPEYDSQYIFPKDSVSMIDLAALTAKTGDEFAMFTRGSQRLVIRGNSVSVNVNVDKAKEMAENGYKWSGHTHPGVDFNCLMASSGDIDVLKAFRQEYSVIYNSLGQYLIFYQ